MFYKTKFDDTYIAYLMDVPVKFVKEARKKISKTK